MENATVLDAEVVTIVPETPEIAPETPEVKVDPKTLPFAERITVKPGFLIRDNSTATGGITYDRKHVKQYDINGGDGQAVVTNVTRMVDNIDHVARINKIKTKVYTLCRKYCVDSFMGWLADEEGARKITEEVAKIRAMADFANARAAEAGCERRVFIRVVVQPFSIDYFGAAPEMARSVREAIVNLRDALRNGEVFPKGRSKDVDPNMKDSWSKTWLNCRNLDILAVGPAKDSIRFALDRALVAKGEIRAAVKRGETPESAGRSVDLSLLDSAVDFFMEDGYLPPIDFDAGMIDSDEEDESEI